MQPANFIADLERFVQEQFVFLEEKGFRVQPIEKARGYTTIRYIGDRLGFDMYLEFVDSTLIEGLINVQTTATQDSESVTTPQPRRNRPFFGALSNTLGLTDPRIEQVSIAKRARAPWSFQVFETIIRLDSDLLHDYIDALAQLPIATLFPPNVSKGSDLPKLI